MAVCWRHRTPFLDIGHLLISADAALPPLQVPPEYGSVLEASYSLPGHLAISLYAEKLILLTTADAVPQPLQVPPEYGSVLEASYSLPGHLATGVSADVTLTFTPKVGALSRRHF